MKFSELKIKDELLKEINKTGFEDLTDIQANTIPPALEGRDVLGQAQTGTGKTLAFSIPIINGVESFNKNVQALILVPTRELALQVCKEINNLSQEIGISAIAIFGGDSIDKQIKDLKKNPQIVVATPGRCIDLIDRNKLKIKNLKFFALDEVDEMLNMGFIEDVDYILSKAAEHKQTLLFSATMPDKIKQMSKKYLIDPEVVKVKSKSIVADRVEQFYIKSKNKQKKLILKHLIDLNPDDKIIIFTQTKRSADDVVDFLLGQKINVGKIHGDLVQKARSNTIQKFRDNEIRFLVATDVVARGIDIDDVNLVINYELPQDIEYYIHRIGRTARGVKNTGKSITLVSPNIYDKEFRFYARDLKVTINEMPIPTIDSVINTLKNKVKEDVIRQNVDTDKVFSNLTQELLSIESPEHIIMKLLKKSYPELSKEEHLKIVKKFENESQGGGQRGSRSNNRSRSSNKPRSSNKSKNKSQSKYSGKNNNFKRGRGNKKQSRNK